MEHSTVGSLLRSTQAFCSQLCERQTLEYGIAYYSLRFAQLPEANQFREVVVEDPASMPQAFDEAEHWFGQHDLFCYRWAPAGGQTSDELAIFLKSRGFRQHTSQAMVLTEWVEIQPAQDVRVLHARAMRAALRETFLDTDSPASETTGELLADACEERLNDPQFDMFVAVVEGKPAGRCALYQVGDIARVMGLHVLTRYLKHGVDRALTAHVLSLARRLTMRKICLQIDNADAQERKWFEQLGFIADGTIIEFHHRPPEPFSQTP